MIGNTDITQVGMLLGACATLGGVIAALWRLRSRTAKKRHIQPIARDF